MTTAVFVHGNPETAAIWGPLFDVLGRDDVVTLSPPGFGAPVPAGFGMTRQDYVDWLVGELGQFAEPVDLVGHDWGGGHVLGAAMAKPEAIRSWCSDIAGCLAPDYVWHDFAQIWQTEGAGEEFVANNLATPVADRAALYESLGMTPEVALSVGEAFTEDMGKAVLTLYRSAAQPAMAKLGERLGELKARPGLVIAPTEDTFTGGEDRARWAAEQAGATVEVLEGLGHWWMLQDPQAGANALRRFWKILDEAN